MGVPVFWQYCHCRGTESWPRLIWLLRTELWLHPFSRSRAFGPMLPPSVRSLWPFFVRSTPDPAGRRRIALDALVPRGRLRSLQGDHSPVPERFIKFIYYDLWPARLASCRRLAQWYGSLALIQRCPSSNPAAGQLQKLQKLQKLIGILRQIEQSSSPITRLVLNLLRRVNDSLDITHLP